MDEWLVEISTDESLERLRASGARVIHEFGELAIVESSADVDALGLRVVDVDTSEIQDRSTSSLSVAAYRLRQTPKWQARRRARRHRNVDIDDLIDGEWT